MKNKIKVIFLDIDGVLNGPSRLDMFIFTYIGSKIEFVRKLLRRKFKNPKKDPYGIHEDKVKRLAKICKITGAKIVLSSSWRGIVFEGIKDISKSTPDVKRLLDLFDKYKIEIIDKTPRDYNGNRGNEIYQWLAKHENEVENFIIFDDEYFGLDIFFDYKDFKDKNKYYPNSKLILTSNCTPYKLPEFTSRWYCKSGLRNIHVKAAIEHLKPL